jgi:hypothetical protein
VQLQVERERARVATSARNHVRPTSHERDRLGQRTALAISALEHLPIERPCQATAADGGHAEVGRLLGQEVDHLQRVLKPDLLFSEAARDLDRAEHPDHPIEPTAPGDRVDVRPEDDRREILPIAHAMPEQVADRVDLRQQPGIGHLFRQPRPRSRVLGCEWPARPAGLIDGVEGAKSLPVSVKALLSNQEMVATAVGCIVHRPEDTE